MERTWLETIQLLGLDVEAGLVLGMLGLEALARLAGRLRSFARIWLGKARLDQLRWGSDPAPVLDLLHRFREELLTRPPLRVEELALNGRDLISLGLKPSPRFGEILGFLMEQVLEDPELNTRERLLELLDAAPSGFEESR